MKTIDKYIQQQHKDFDVTAFMDPDVQSMEVKFAGDFLYKYYSANRRSFFETRQIRFTQKTALNDRFELSKRWHEFGSPPIRGHFAEAIKRSLMPIFSNPNFIALSLKEELASKGTFLAPDQFGLLIERLMSPNGQAMLSTLQKNAEQMIGPFIDSAFVVWEEKFDELIERYMHELGIFSVSESPTNEQLWALYASEGKGFVVTYNLKHPFFRTAKGELMDDPLFHKVAYRDGKIPDFWRNPFYLFAVKSMNWSFEKEWRMIKKGTECDYIDTVSGERLYLCDVKIGMIHSVIFGYDYDATQMKQDMENVSAFDPAVHFKQAKINLIANQIDIVDV